MTMQEELFEKIVEKKDNFEVGSLFFLIGLSSGFWSALILRSISIGLEYLFFGVGISLFTLILIIASIAGRKVYWRKVKSSTRAGGNS